jgi:fructokinase
VGIPGALTPEGLVKNANSTWLIGNPLGRDLEARLSRPVRLMNDANCFAISEAADGAGAGTDVVFGVILGTGVGGGIVVNGQCLAGANSIAGEWGHNPLPWMSLDEYPGSACYCGKRGCIETFLSGPAFERDFAEQTGMAMASRAIVVAAAHGESGARQALARYYDRLARALAGLINVLDPDVVVLGGGMSNLPLLAESVTALLPRYVFSNSVRTRVVPNVHGDASGVRGAAWLLAARSRRRDRQAVTPYEIVVEQNVSVGTEDTSPSSVGRTKPSRANSAAVLHCLERTLSVPLMDTHTLRQHIGRSFPSTRRLNVRVIMVAGSASRAVTAARSPAFACSHSANDAA